MKKQTIKENKDLKEYARLNATSLIKRLIELIEYQENVVVTYNIKN